MIVIGTPDAPPPGAEPFVWFANYSGQDLTFTNGDNVIPFANGATIKVLKSQFLTNGLGSQDLVIGNPESGYKIDSIMSAAGDFSGTALDRTIFSGSGMHVPVNNLNFGYSLVYMFVKHIEPYSGGIYIDNEAFGVDVTLKFFLGQDSTPADPSTNIVVGAGSGTTFIPLSAMPVGDFRLAMFVNVPGVYRQSFAYVDPVNSTVAQTAIACDTNDAPYNVLGFDAFNRQSIQGRYATLVVSKIN